LFKQIIPALLQTGVICKATPEEFVSCPFWVKGTVVPRKIGLPRLIADLRETNENTQKERMQLPRIEEIVQNMHGCKYFSIIDISFAFWNIALHPESQIFTLTCTPIGDYVWQRLPMGLSSSPSTMQILIEHMLHGVAQAVGFHGRYHCWIHLMVISMFSIIFFGNVEP
jgi:hypothetical protein